MMGSKKPVLLGILGILAAVQTPTPLAQTVNSDKSLGDIEVISSTPLPGTGASLSETPSAIQLRNSKAIELANPIGVADFLSTSMSSVYVNEVQGNPFQPDVNFRGYTASPLLGTPQGLSVYLDGVRMNQPFGDVVSWDLLPKTAISTLTLMPGSNPLFGLNSPSRIIRFSAFKQPAKRDGAVVRRQFSLPVSEFPFSTHSEAQKSRAQKGPRP